MLTLHYEGEQCLPTTDRTKISEFHVTHIFSGDTRTRNPIWRHIASKTIIKQVAWGTAPERYVLQENTGKGWENIATYKFFEYAIEGADELAELHPQHQYRIIDTKEKTS